MKDKDKRPIYEPPRARDLSVSSVSGGGPQPLGLCADGIAPYNDCAIGEDTSDPSAGCHPVGGNAAHDPQCRPGSNASVDCKAGRYA